jgi:hypothetical protein
LNSANIVATDANVGPAAVFARNTDNDIVVAVPIKITGRDGCSEFLTNVRNAANIFCALVDKFTSGSSDSVGRSVQDIDCSHIAAHTSIAPAAVLARNTDHDIVVTVPIDVTRSDRRSEPFIT